MSGEISSAAAAAGLEALRSGWLTMGPRTEAFEEELRLRFGAEHAVATSSGTAALHLSCIAVGGTATTQILVPALAPRSCLGAPRAAGAEPIVYDLEGVDPDPELVLRSAESTTRAVIARHPLGFPAELEPLAQACRARGLALIEDCRDALGARTAAGRYVGAVGEVATLSFSSARQVSANEGGAVLTDDAGIAAKIRSLRSHAMTSGTWDRHRGHAETYDVVDVGFNYRIDEIRAAVGRVGLAELDAAVAIRRQRAVSLAGDALLPGLALERSSPLAVPLVFDGSEERSALRDSLPGKAKSMPATEALLAPASEAPRADVLARSLLLVAVPGS